MINLCWNRSKHNCKLVGKLGELVYFCSRCGKCYQCRHKAIYLDQEDRWVWKCPDGKLRPVIVDWKR